MRSIISKKKTGSKGFAPDGAAVCAVQSFAIVAILVENGCIARFCAAEWQRNEMKPNGYDSISTVAGSSQTAGVRRCDAVV